MMQNIHSTLEINSDHIKYYTFEKLYQNSLILEFEYLKLFLKIAQKLKSKNIYRDILFN